ADRPDRRDGGGRHHRVTRRRGGGHRCGAGRRHHHRADDPLQHRRCPDRGGRARARARRVTPRALPDGARVRAARPGDEPGILALIEALALYEKEPDAVRNTTAQLGDSLFGPEPRLFAHVVEADGPIVRIASRFLTYQTWLGPPGIRLEDLYVDEAQRGRGYGKALMASLAEVCVARGYGRFEWTVLDWNAPSIAFYRSIGAEPLDEWTTQRLTGAALTRLAGA